MKTTFGALALLALSGCFNPDDILPVKGAVTSVDGVEGHPVNLYRQPQQSFGPCDVSVGTPFKQATTGGDGAFGFELFRAQTQNLATQGPYCFLVDVRFPSGSRAWTDLQGVYDATTLPLLHDWHPDARLGDGGVLVVQPPIPLPDESAALDGSVVDGLVQRVEVVTSDGGVVWRADDLLTELVVSPEPTTPVVPRRVPLVLDEVRLEDFTGSARLQAQVVEYGDDVPLDVGPRFGSTNYSSTLEAGQRLAVSGARVPVSRGVPCPEVATPCPLTDGDLTVVELELRERVSLTLPTAVPLTAVVLRGVETSTPVVAAALGLEDGGTVSPAPLQLPTSSWYQAPRGPLPDGGFDRTFGASFYAVVPLTVDGGPTVVPIKRVTLFFPGGLGRAAEVSLFE